MTESYLSDSQLAQRFGVNRATPWRWIKDNDFPQPIKLGPQCTRWRLSDVENWEARRAARPVSTTHAA